MADIKEIRKELIAPSICTYIISNGKQLCVNLNTGHVYLRPYPRHKYTPSLEYLNKNDFSIIEWQYVSKYDILALVQWKIPCLLFITSDGVGRNLNPDELAEKEDKRAEYRWKLTDFIKPIAVITVDRQKRVQYDGEDGNRLKSADFIKSQRNIDKTYEYGKFWEFFGPVYVGRNEYSYVSTPGSISRFFKVKDPEIKTSSKQRKINELCKLPLKDPRENKEVQYCWKDSVHGYCYVSKVNSEWTVARWFQKGSRSRELSYLETHRLYFNDKICLFCRINLKNEFVYTSGNFPINTLWNDHVVVESCDVFNGTKMQYFPLCNDLSKRALDGYKSGVLSTSLYMFMFYPEFEMIWKAGFENICTYYLQCPFGSWRKWVVGCFGNVNFKAKNINQLLGMNNYQIQQIFDKFNLGQNTYNRREIIAQLKEVFDTNDLRALDNQSFDAVVNVLKASEPVSMGLAVRVLRKAVDVYSVKKMLNMCPKFSELIKNSFAAFEFANVFIQFEDVLEMVKILGASKIIKPYFANFEHLKQTHQLLVEAINNTNNNENLELRLKKIVEAHERFANDFEEKFQARKKEWSKWEYRKDDRYVVVSPEKTIDITHEGIALNHCVGTYLCRVVNGETNIMFVRQKDKENVPFFTVEISNDGIIRQIHGDHNCDVDSKPGLENFVQKWAQDVKVKYNKYAA